MDEMNELSGGEIYYREIQSLRAQLERADKVYERFKHLDVVLSDKKWMDNDDKIHLVCYELWMAIKKIADKNKEVEP